MLASENLLSIKVVDPAGDPWPSRSDVIDVIEMEMVFAPETGEYEITLQAHPDHPFNGDFRVNIILLNVDAQTFFVDNVNDYLLAEPTETLVLTGTANVLTGWDLGDQIYTTNRGGVPELPPGTSFTLFTTSILDHDPSGQDIIAFEDLTQPAIVEVATIPDTDGDGILDPDDACPGEYGEPEHMGCPTSPDDRDGDGVPNDLDACPDTYGTAALNGCPAPRPTEPSELDLVAVRTSFSVEKWPPSGSGGSRTVFFDFTPSALIGNAGPEAVEDFWVTFSLSDPVGRTLTWNTPVNVLAPGQAIWVRPAHRSQRVYPGTYNLTAVVDSRNRIVEADEGNNAYSIRAILGSD